ncbi:MAG: type II toxin-antitoxin system HicA family toxin [Candidatus Nomurabacteria bacterium]|nr:type II toxin-antitoxin system HicA family toxin [Candidatus Nomurabacteria bacterium]
MQKLKQLSGREVVKIFESHGFQVKRIVGSHTRLTLLKDDNSYHVTIPLHNPVKKGTLHSIMKDFELCFGKEETNKCFYN